MNTLKEYVKVNIESVRSPQSEGAFVNLLNKEMEELLAKDRYTKIKNHPASDIVILTKDEFNSMIKTDKEAEEYGQQCWNDGMALGQKEAAKKCIEWFFSNTVFTPQKVKEFAAQFGVNVITEE